MQILFCPAQHPAAAFWCPTSSTSSLWNRRSTCPSPGCGATRWSGISRVYSAGSKPREGTHFSSTCSWFCRRPLSPNQPWSRLRLSPLSSTGDHRHCQPYLPICYHPELCWLQPRFTSKFPSLPKISPRFSELSP